MSSLILDGKKKKNAQKQRFLKFFERGQYADCTFIVGGKTKIRCHKIILASASPVFEAMLFGPLASSEIVIMDILPEDMQQVISYIYTDEVTFSSVQNAWSIMYIVKKYLIDDLLELCRDYIGRHIDCNTALLSYEYSELYSDFAMQKECISMISRYLQAMLKVCMDYHISPSTFKSLLEIENLNVIEKDLIEFAVQWAKTECAYQKLEPTKENIRDVLVSAGIFSKLRFIAVPLREYSEAMCELLMEEEMSLISEWQKGFCEEHLERLEERNINCQLIPRNNELNRLSLRLRQIYKASSVLIIEMPTSVKTGIVSTKRVILMGLMLGIKRYRDNGVMQDYYHENFDIEILNDANETILKKNVNKTMDYQTFNVIDFEGSVVLEEKRHYDIVVSWTDVTPPFMIYGTYILEPSLKNVNFDVSFVDSDYSIIQGLYIF